MPISTLHAPQHFPQYKPIPNIISLPIQLFVLLITLWFWPDLDRSTIWKGSPFGIEPRFGSEPHLEDMAAMMSTAAMVAAAPNVAQLASGSSVAFNNGGVRTNLVMARRSARPMTVRVVAEDSQSLGDKLKGVVSDAKNETLSRVEDIKSSTGELNPAKAKAAEEDNPDGTSVMDKLKDAGRTLKSKTNDVVEYGTKRNSPDVADNATEKNIKDQSNYTKGL